MEKIIDNPKYVLISFGLPTKDQELDLLGVMVRDIVFNATFNNISVIWWQSVLLMEEMNTHCLYGIRTHNVSGDRH